MIVGPLILFTLLVAVWWSMGRSFAVRADRLLPARTKLLPVSPLEYDGGGFRIGGLSMTFGLTNNERADLRLTTDSSNRVILSVGPDAFVVGPRTNPVDPRGRPEITFVPESGDEIVFTTRQGLLAWRAPIQINIFGGSSPRWKRYVYYRLMWKRRCGEVLEMSWRYEQDYYPGRGWTAPLMMWNSYTGLLQVSIRSGAVGEYVKRTKGWDRSEYAIQHLGTSEDGTSERFAVVHASDAVAMSPGAGKSFEILVDCAKQQVMREIGGQ